MLNLVSSTSLAVTQEDSSFGKWLLAYFGGEEKQISKWTINAVMAAFDGCRAREGGAAVFRSDLQIWLSENINKSCYLQIAEISEVEVVTEVMDALDEWDD